MTRAARFTLVLMLLATVLTVSAMASSGTAFPAATMAATATTSPPSTQTGANVIDQTTPSPPQVASAMDSNNVANGTQTIISANSHGNTNTVSTANALVATGANLAFTLTTTATGATTTTGAAAIDFGFTSALTGSPPADSAATFEVAAN